MTNIIAAVIVTLSTNWTTIGTANYNNGQPAEDIQRGQLMTNITAIIEWKGTRKELLIESAPGPSVGEKRVPQPNITWYGPTNMVYFTNITPGIFNIRAISNIIHTNIIHTPYYIE